MGYTYNRWCMHCYTTVPFPHDCPNDAKKVMEKPSNISEIVRLTNRIRGVEEDYNSLKELFYGLSERVNQLEDRISSPEVADDPGYKNMILKNSAYGIDLDELESGYTVLVDESLERIIRSFNILMANSWIPQGGINYAAGEYHQAMVRKY